MEQGQVCIPMKNWLDQDIVEGSIVYRAARSGNTTDHRVGIVRGFRPVKDQPTATPKVRIQWCLGADGTTTVDMSDVVLIDLTWQFLVDRMEDLYRKTIKRNQEWLVRYPHWEPREDPDPWWRRELTAP
jgi:hypothetical protein